MLEQLIDLIKQHSQQAVVNNPDVPNGQDSAVTQEAGSTIVNTLQSLLANGKASDVLSLFSNKTGEVSNHPVTQEISGNFISNLMSKFGLSGQQAGGIAESLLPVVLSKLVSKTNDPSDGSFNIQSIFNSLSGNSTSGLDIQNILSKFTGGGTTDTTNSASNNPLDKNGDGNVDLKDITAAFNGNKAADNTGVGGI